MILLISPLKEKNVQKDMHVYGSASKRLFQTLNAVMVKNHICNRIFLLLLPALRWYFYGQLVLSQMVH